MSGQVVPDSQFQALVAERIAAGNPEREDSPTYLLKRLKQLEQEKATLRQKKRSRPEDAAAQLLGLEALERISALIEDASDRGSFGLAQSTPEGNALVRILVLAAVTTKPGATAPRCR